MQPLPLLQATPPAGQSNLLFQLFPFLLIFAVFYFLLIRPARVKQKRHQEMLQQLKNGDRVLTSGGIYGTIVGISGGTVQLRVADKVKIEIQKSSISERVEEKS